MELLRLLGKDTSGLPCLSPHGFTSAPRRRSPPKAHRPRAANKAAAKVGALGNCIRWLFWGQKWLGISLIRQNTQIESRRLDLGFLYCSLSGNTNRLATGRRRQSEFTKYLGEHSSIHGTRPATIAGTRPEELRQMCIRYSRHHKHNREHLHHTVSLCRFPVTPTSGPRKPYLLSVTISLF